VQRQGSGPGGGQTGIGPPTGPESPATGILELPERGDGYLRDQKRNYEAGPEDVRVPRAMIDRMGLRGGELLDGVARGDQPTRRQLTQINAINEKPADKYSNLASFDTLTVIDPGVPIRFETPNGPMTMRVVDMLTPIGRGQRGLLVAPPRTGKTILLTHMATAVAANYPDIRLIMLLVDERPEEVTEMRRTIGAAVRPDGGHTPEVFYSSNDRDAENHIRLARLVISRAKRCVEQGEHVLIFLDSITRLGRAFNTTIRSSGRTMSGGIDIRALTEPKGIFGAARTIEHGGSLTIIATALIETGSRGDEYIFQEFKGTGNMELVLTRELSDMRIWPAVDISKSGTRKEERLLPQESIEKIYRIRRKLLNMGKTRQIEQLVLELGQYKSNAEFLAAMAD
jgi:transcription termination factor Rho